MQAECIERATSMGKYERSNKTNPSTEKNFNIIVVQINFLQPAGIGYIVKGTVSVHFNLP